VRRQATAFQFEGLGRIGGRPKVDLSGVVRITGIALGRIGATTAGEQHEEIALATTHVPVMSEGLALTREMPDATLDC
jgi:hypothetical protein